MKVLILLITAVIIGAVVGFIIRPVDNDKDGVHWT